MDFSYENNKGLHAFFIALVMILGLFTVFAPTSTYAATSVPRTEKADYPKITDSQFNSWIARSDIDGMKEFQIIHYMNSSNEKYTLYLAVQDKSQITNDTGTGTLKITGRYQAVTSSAFNAHNAFDQSKASNPTISYKPTTFFMPTPPAKPFPGQLAVKEVPGILAGQAGTIVLVGCLILGTLLVVGLVKRLISLFIR